MMILCDIYILSQYEPPTDVTGIKKSRLRVQEDVKQRKSRSV